MQPGVGIHNRLEETVAEGTYSIGKVVVISYEVGSMIHPVGTNQPSYLMKGHTAESGGWDAAWSGHT